MLQMNDSHTEAHQILKGRVYSFYDFNLQVE